MSKYVKNNTSTTQIWCGQEIASNTYYLLESFEYKIWGTNSTFLAALATQDAIVASTNDGTTDYTDYNEALIFIRDEYAKDVNIINTIDTSGVKDPKGMRARLIGIINATINKGSTQNLDWECTSAMYAGNDAINYFNGIQYYAQNAIIGDHAHFQVIDKNGAGVTAGLYPQAYYDAYKDTNGELIVEEFGNTWYMIPDTMEDIMLYKARVVPGLFIRIQYTSVGNINDINIIVNLFRHMQL